MKRNFLIFGSIIFAISFIAIISVSCQKETDTFVNETTLSQEKINLINQMVNDEKTLIIPSDNYANKFSELNTDELDYYLQMLAKKWVSEEIKDDSYNQQHTEEELFNIRIALFREMAKKATKVFNKSMNQLSQEEVLELVDKHMEEIFFNAEENSPESTQKIFKEIISYNLESDEILTSNAKSAGCPEYYYGILTKITSSGTKTCTSYESATNPGNNDCDYEFNFAWNYNYSPTYALGLYGSSWGVRQVLNMGGVNGRIVSTNSVRFLIGKGRITLYCLGSPSHVKSNLKGNW